MRFKDVHARRLRNVDDWFATDCGVIRAERCYYRKCNHCGRQRDRKDLAAG